MDNESSGLGTATAQQLNNPSAINQLVAQLTRQQQQNQQQQQPSQQPGVGQQGHGDYQDRINSMNSNSQGVFQQAPGQPPLPGTSGLAPIAALNHFTASFPPGPQQDLVPSLPWFAQMQVRIRRQIQLVHL